MQHWRQINTSLPPPNPQNPCPHTFQSLGNILLPLHAAGTTGIMFVYIKIQLTQQHTQRERSAKECKEKRKFADRKKKNLEKWGERKWQGSGSVPPAYIESRCTEEWVLTLHSFAKALPQLPAMFLEQPVPDVILAERREEKKTKNIPIIREAFPRGHWSKNRQTNKQTK